MGVVFIGQKTVFDIEFVPVKHFRSVAFLAGFPDRPQGGDGLLDRPGVGVKKYGKKLSGA
jgi:hypothetical protein